MSRSRTDTKKRKRRELLVIDEEDIDKEDYDVVRRMMSDLGPSITDYVYRNLDVREDDEERRVHCLDFNDYLSSQTTRLYLPDVIGNLSNLNKLLLRDCDIQRIPPSIGRLKNLKELDLSYNFKLSVLPNEIGDLVSLVKLNLECLRDLSFLPPSIGRLRNLKELNLKFCSGLSEFPEEFWDLTSLIKLDLHQTSISSLPPSIGRLRNLQYLDLLDSAISSLPPSIGQLGNLQQLNLRDASQLEKLPEEIGKLSSLEILNLEGASSITSLPTSVGRLASLKFLSLRNVHIPELLGDDTEEFVMKLAQRCPLLGILDHESMLENGGKLGFALACNRARSRISLFGTTREESALTITKLLPHMLHNARRAFDAYDLNHITDFTYVKNDRENVKNSDAIRWFLLQNKELFVRILIDRSTKNDLL